MKKLIMTYGLPASGKSTWAKEMIAKDPTYKRVNKDELRKMVDYGKWSKDNEKCIVEMRDSMIARLMELGYNIIVDDTNLHPKHGDRFKELVKLFNEARDYRPDFCEYEFEVKSFTDVPLRTCLDRDKDRTKPVGAKVILGMYKQFLKKDDVKPVIDSTLPYCIICDLDGTLAIAKDRSMYSDNVENDDVCQYVLTTVATLMGTFSPDMKLFFFSGRKESARESTVGWLQNKCCIVPNMYELFMRENGDQRRDSVVKRELYDNHILGKYNVFAVFDDRPQVIRECWEVLGVNLFRCGTGEEF